MGHFQHFSDFSVLSGSSGDVRRRRTCDLTSAQSSDPEAAGLFVTIIFKMITGDASWT